ncbi:MAG TPA: prepilin-type N-terminal cleavage/methylation domain-containing protein [Candidatus Obscuribacterales bacterium]
MINSKKTCDRSLTSSDSGFTLIEQLIIILIIGVLSAIAAPSWLGFINNQRLNTSIDRIYWAMQTTRAEAKLNKETRQISFRDQNNTVQWAIHRPDETPTENQWTILDQGVQIDEAETTLYQNKTTKIWRMQFDYKGRANGQLGRVTISLRNGSTAKRCTFVSTLLGTLRKSKNNLKPKDGKYCY